MPAIAMKSINPDHYPIVAQGNPQFHRNVAWYATPDDRVVGVIVHDQIDNDFGWVVMGDDPDEPPGLRCVNLGTSYRSEALATAQLWIEMARYPHPRRV